jgi:hypothetical protein
MAAPHVAAALAATIPVPADPVPADPVVADPMAFVPLAAAIAWLLPPAGCSRDFCSRSSCYVATAPLSASSTNIYFLK